MRLPGRLRRLRRQGLPPVRINAAERARAVVHVATVATTLDAPPRRVFEALRANAEGRGGSFEYAEVVRRAGERLVCDFWTVIPLPLGRRFRFRTREAVELEPPDRLHYRHLSGPSRGIAETILVRGLPGQRSEVVYRAVYPAASRLVGLAFAVVAKPVAHLFMRIHFEELRSTTSKR